LPVETHLSKDFERVHKVVVAFGTAFYKVSFMNIEHADKKGYFPHLVVSRMKMIFSEFVRTK
jgi:hypothetical protein